MDEIKEEHNNEETVKLNPPVQEQTDEEALQAEQDLAAKNSAGLSLKTILGGDFLTSDFLRRQVPLLVLIVIFTIIYISNRYSSQQELIEIDNLKKQLVDIKYDALTLSSELTEKTRQSRIEDYVAKQDSLDEEQGPIIGTATNPPYKIKE